MIGKQLNIYFCTFDHFSPDFCRLFLVLHITYNQKYLTTDCRMCFHSYCSVGRALQVYLVTIHDMSIKRFRKSYKCSSLTHADWPSTSAALVALVTKSFLIAEHYQVVHLVPLRLQRCNTAMHILKTDYTG